MITTAKRSFFSVLALVFAFTALFSAQALQAAPGTVISKKGNVTADGKSVGKGDKVSTGDLFVVPPGGQAVIDFGPEIGRVTLEPGTTAVITLDDDGNILVTLRGEGGGASVEPAAGKSYAVNRAGGSPAGGDGGGGGGGIGGATGLGLAGLASGSGFGGGAGTGPMTPVTP
jgi:hypothetical protein